jgi:hypothetical protein
VRHSHQHNNHLNGEGRQSYNRKKKRAGKAHPISDENLFNYWQESLTICTSVMVM